MCACGDAMLTSDVKVSTTSLRKTFVSWATEPRRPDQRIMFRTLRDFTLSEITNEVCKFFYCLLPFKDIFRAQNFNPKLINCVTSLPFIALSQVALKLSVLAPKTNIKSCLLGILCHYDCYFFQSLSVPFLSCLRRLARKSKWAKEDKRSAANTGFTRLYPRGLFWLLVTWKPKVNSSVYQFTSSTNKSRLTTSKNVDRDVMGRQQPPDPPPPIPIFIEGNEKIKQNKIKIVRYLTETKLWRNAIISLKLIDLRTGQIELKNFFFDTEIIIQ